MEKKSVDLKEYRLTYQEKNPDQRNSIIFIHGNSNSSRFWLNQLQDPDFSSYRLIAFDLPAHGDSTYSGKSIPNYSIPAIGKIIANAVEALALPGKYVLGGISLGTNIVTESLSCGIDPDGVFLASPSILGLGCSIEKIFLPELDTRFLFTHDLDRHTVKKSYRESLPTTPPDAIEWIVDDYFSVQLPFRSALSETVSLGKVSDEILILQNYGRPVLMIFGQDEKVVDPNYLDSVCLPLWNREIYKLSGGHFLPLDNSSQFNSLLITYCNDILK